MIPNAVRSVLARSPQAAGRFLVVCAFAALGAARADAAPLLSDLRVEQGVAKKGEVYGISPQIAIHFTLAKAAAATVRIERHQDEMLEWNGPYLVDTYPVRTLDLGKLAAGPQTVTWDGLGADGKEVTHTRSVHASVINREKRDDPAAFVEAVRADLFKIVVESGKEQLHVNYRRRSGTVDTNLRIYPFQGCAVDPAGNLVFPAESRGFRFSPVWAQVMVHIGASQSADPVNAFDCAVDSRGDAYLINHAGVYRFSKEGPPANWKADQDYANYPYPSDFKTVLGVRLNAEAPTEKKQYVFGPGGNGHYKYWVTNEMLGKPGFSLTWAGLAIDKADNVFVASADPIGIQVFDNAGNHLRTLKLPDGVVPGKMRFGIDGTLWTATGNGLYCLNPENGEAKKRVGEKGYNTIFIDRAGNIYVSAGPTLARFSSAGEPLPFAANSTHVAEPNNTLLLHYERHKAPPQGFDHANQIGAIYVAADGSFYVSEAHTGRLLHFSADGIYQPLPFSVTVGQHDPGNVFLDGRPTAYDLLVTNLTERPLSITTAWTLTDFDGREQRGVSTLALSASASQVAQLVVPAAANGHYRLYAEMKLDGTVYATLKTMLARIPSRRIFEDRYSPFAMCWGNNFALMAYAGVKSHRGDSASWAHCFEPRDGVFYPQRENGQNFSDGLEAPRRYARRWGICQLNGLDYGESWLGNYDLISRIWSYDRFNGYVLRVLDIFAGKGEAFYQLWNEPNFFWHVPGPFGREHFGLVTKHVWCMVKARDNDAFCIPDGDAGGLGIMEEMARWDVAPCNDGVQFHYPGAKPIKMDEITVPNTPEGKVPMCESLVALRDKSFPGKPVWNTEEGWWGTQVKTLPMGAVMLPRTCIPQMAAGIDKIYWFMSVSPDDPTYMLNEKEEPYPTYVSYATMTSMLDPAVCVGGADIGKGNYAFLFARQKDMVLAVWRLGTLPHAEAAIPAGVKRAAVTDLMGRSRTVEATDRQITLDLNDHVQYVELPRNDWTLGIARQHLAGLLKKAAVPSVKEIAGAVRATAPNAATDLPSMNRLYYLIRAAEMAAVADDAPGKGGKAAELAAAARRDVIATEGADGYLRQARVALEWVDRLATRPLIGGNTWAVRQAADAARAIAASERPCYPGAVINAFIGEPGEIAKIRAIVPKANDYSTTIDEKFRFQINRKPGEAFDLELTVWNYYRHPISGTVSPRLPEGWKASQGAVDFSLEPGRFGRALVTVTIPADAKPSVYTVGGQTHYQGQPVKEIHAQRISVP